MARVYRFPEPSPPHPAFIAAQREAIVYGLEQMWIDPLTVFPDARTWTAPRPPRTASAAVLARWAEQTNAGWAAGVALLDQILTGAQTMRRKAA